MFCFLNTNTRFCELNQALIHFFADNDDYNGDGIPNGGQSNPAVGNAAKGLCLSRNFVANTACIVYDEKVSSRERGFRGLNHLCIYLGLRRG